MVKRLLSLVLCLILALGCLTLASAATPIEAEVYDPTPQLRLSYIADTLTNISIVNGSAICVGNLTGYQGTTTKVEITLTLQRKLSTSSTWDDWYNHPMQTFNNYKGTASFTKTVEKGYQYRTKAFYKAYAGSNSESLTAYSGAQSY